MKKKILIIPLFFLILISNVKAQTEINYTILSDSHVRSNQPNNNFGTTTNIQVLDNSGGTIMRSYLTANMSDIVSGVEIINATLCYYLSSDGTTTNISVYEVTNLNGTIETTITWNNQPCGTSFDNTTNCNLTIIDTQDTTGTGWYCWNVQEKIQEYYTEEKNNITFALKSQENTSSTVDVFDSRENGGNTPYLNVIHSELTNLSLNYETIFLIGESNLLEINYSMLESGLIVDNATCNVSFGEDYATANYNNSTGLYEVYIIPDEHGIFGFNVDCSAIYHTPQVQNVSVNSYFFSGTPYNVSVRMFTELNASEENSYIDDFANIILRFEDYNCSTINPDGTSECYVTQEYEEGEALFQDLIGIGNTTLYYYSGLLTTGEYFEQPNYETFNALKYLGNFEFNENRTQLWLYIDEAEINFMLTLQRFALTYGLLIVGVIIAFAVAIGVFWFSGKNFAVGFFAFIITLYLLMVIGVIPDISDLLGVILS